MSHNEDADVGCPFYRGIKKGNSINQIHCEGITDDCTLALLFKNRAAMKEQLQLFCCDCWQMCEIYRMLMDTKY